MNPKIFFARFLLGLALLSGAALFAGSARAVSSSIAISQVYGGGGNSGATYTHDFIELFNRGATPIDITGWTLQYTASSGSTWQTTELSGTLLPGQYFLVQQAQGSGGTTPLPTPDAAGTLAMSASSGKVALVSATGALSGSCPAGAELIDLVGYGSANCFEGSAAAPALGSTTAALRGEGGCIESDDNSADFTAEAPAPRNSASPFSACTVATDPGGSGAADPNPAAPGSTTLLTVAVVPGTNPDSTGLVVSGDLSAVGGPASQPFFDDGSSGDAVPGDLVFSFQAGLPESIAPGTRDLPISIHDDQGRSGETLIALEVSAPVAEPLVINEVDYDQDGTDSAEFVEILNTGSSAVSLAGASLELVNGSGGGADVYQVIALPDVSLAPGATFVVCSDAANVPTCSLDVSPDTNLMQNGGPDAVGLRQGGLLLDAVSYEGDSGAPYTEASGLGLEDPGTAALESISRCPDGADTDQNNVDFSLRTSTPGAPNACQDNQPPTVSAGGPYSVEEGGALSVSALGGDPDGDALSYAWDLDDDGTFETPGQSAEFPVSGLDGPSEHTIQVQAIDPGGLSAVAQSLVTVANAQPAVSVGPALQAVQYSDPVSSVSIEAWDVPADIPLDIESQWRLEGGSFTSGLPDWLDLSSNGCGPASCTWSLTGTALAAPGTYVVSLAIGDKDGGVSEGEISIQVVPEEARTAYSGAQFAAATSPDGSTASVTLAATVLDITAASPDEDPHPGDVRNAEVTFFDRASGEALCSAPVGLVEMGEAGTGTAACIWTADMGNAESISVPVGILVAGHYLHDDPAADVILNVSRPLLGALATGTGHIVLDGPAGLLAGDEGSPAVFGLYARIKRGWDLAGRLNFLVRRTEAGGVHLYLFRSNQLTSMAIQSPGGTATINGRAVILDITAPRAPILVDSKAFLQITLYDGGFRGSGDMIGLTFWKEGGGLWFSSSWDGLQTVEQSLAGGNLNVR